MHEGASETLWDDGEVVFSRRRRGRESVLALSVVARHPPRTVIERLQREYALRHDLDPAWAVRPVELSDENGRIAIMFDDPGGLPLSELVGRRQLEVIDVLRIGVGSAASLARCHERGLVHRDIKPAHILWDAESGRARLTGFGLASRLPRERRPLEPPRLIEGTLPYMSPEQTGRMNRSVDSRSDLYSLGVTLHEALTGELPFEAFDPTEWIHCHLARAAPNTVERRSDTPPQVAAIISKLLEKPAERRYQTAAGLAADLHRCLESLSTQGEVSAFPLARADVSTRLIVPERLYGRDRDIEMLCASCERVAGGGELEVVLVSGASGIGKSSIVHELHKTLVPSRGLFAGGKFDPHQCDTPYATLADAFGTPVRHVLAQTEAELAEWRLAITSAVGTSGKFVTDLLPELELVIGQQPPLPDLSPADARARFHATIKSFLGVFARRLVLFLDDLQWLDAATLKLLEWLVEHREGLSLLLICAFRDNEVHAAHPLAPVLDRIRSCGVGVNEIRLTALSPAEISELVADSLQSEQSRVRELSTLVHEKTGGNPFFATEFLKELVHERHVTFDPNQPGWTWDTMRIRAKRHTDNVVELMAIKLTRLSPETQAVLREMSCFGTTATASELALVHGCSASEVDAILAEALHLGIVVAANGDRAFVHDRIQAAAYSQLSEAERRALHLRIGKTLLSRLGEDAPSEDVFRVVSHLNRVVELVHDPGDRTRLRRLNVKAGKKARATVAYANARDFLSVAAGLSLSDAWSTDYVETFDLYLTLAECEFLAGNFALADALFARLLTNARSPIDRARAHCVRLPLYQLAGRYEDGATQTCELLRLFGVHVPESNGDIEAATLVEYQRIPLLLGERSVEDVADAPHVTEASPVALMDLLVYSLPCARVFVGRPALYPFLALKAVAFSLEHGNTLAACRGYSTFAALLVSIFDDIPRAYRFSEMALRLNEKVGRARDRGSLLMVCNHMVSVWHEPFSRVVPVQDKAFTTCLELGDLAFAGYVATLNVWQAFEKGDTLDHVLAASAKYAAFARQAGNEAIHALIRLQQQFVADLQNTTAPSFDEPQDVVVLRKATFGSGIAFHFIMKEVLATLGGRYDDVLVAAAECEPFLSTITALVVEATHHFHHGLALAALAPGRKELRPLLSAKARRFAAWAAHCPENFGARSFLLQAEVARIEGRDLDAIRSYEAAIRLARNYERVHDEALALETTARFHRERGLETAARAYLREAKDAFRRWGALGKVQQLEREHPHLREDDIPLARSTTIGATVDELDLASVVRTMQALTSEIVLERWIAKVLTTALEGAGAGRAVLLMLPEGRLRGVAEAKVAQGGVDVQMLEALPALPEVLLRYVERTRQAVVLDDASSPNEFSDDPYIVGAPSRSILCLPLAKQDALRGVLYLENDLAPRTFTARHMALLRFLAAQAALYLENVWLHDDLRRENESHRQTEAALRRSEVFLAEAQRVAQIGSWLFNAAGFEAWSAEMFRMYGLETNREAPTTEEYLALVHPEDRPFVVRMIRKMVAGHGDFDFTKRILRADGQTRWVRCTGIAATHEGEFHGFVGTAIDITEQHEAHVALQNAQAELARIMRASALGELAASIAHEVSQPLAAISADAAAASNWLAFVPPDTEAVSECLATISADCQRAGDVLSRIKAMLKRESIERTKCDLNAIIAGTLPLVRSQFESKGVTLTTDLAQELPSVLGDPVQLQQVLINLLLNAADACRTLEMDRRRVVVSTMRQRRTEQSWSIASVADTGKGITAEVRTRIFDAFYTTKPEGLGMGLSISRSIVQSHRGELTVEPNLPHGTTFAVGLPSLP